MFPKIPFRKLVSLTTTLSYLTFPISGYAKLGELDVSGSRGTDGRDGTSHHGSASSGFSGSTGSNGRDGGDATDPTSGQSAGSIMAELSKPKQGLFVLNATFIEPGKQQTSQYQSGQLLIGTDGYFFLKARGGDGGKGGRGGDGERGGDGGRGSDATQYSTGDNGGNGGRGGDAGAGTSGASAGKGGKITVQVKENETDLLMLVEENVEGGNGGQAGSHGRPGSGGSGGSGGSSYSWTTTEYYTDTETDSEGNSRTVTNSRTHYHSNSGGMSGSSGSSGHTPSKSLSPGSNGENGNFEIHVITADGSTKTYKQRYDLNLVSYDIVPEDKDGILEPGEKVTIDNLTVRNTGGMPTPEKTKVRIFLRNSIYSVADSVELEIPKSLSAGESFTFNTESLAFVIKNTIFTDLQAERPRWSDHIQPFAKMLEVERPFQKFSSARPIEITFPIELEPIVTARSLAPGENARILIKVKNISSRDFGSASELKRDLEMFIRQSSGDLEHTEFAVTDEAGQPWDMHNGMLKAIEHLKAGQSALVEANIKVSPKASPFTFADIGFRLDIGTPKGLETKTSVQDRFVSFSVSQVYKKELDTDVLLIVNQNIKKEEITALKALAQSIGLTPAVWDISYYGEVALTKALETGSSLIEDFHGMNLIIANNSFDINSQSIRPSQLVSYKELAIAASQAGIGTFVLGNDQNELISAMKQMTVASDKPVTITKRKMFKAPKSNDLITEANEMAETRHHAEPIENFVVVHNFSPQLISSGFLGMGKQWTLGTLQMFDSLDPKDASLVSTNTGRSNQLTPEDITSPSTRLSLALSLSVAKRVKLINYLLQIPDATSEAGIKTLSESLLISIAEEQSALRSTTWRFGQSKSFMEKQMHRLDELVAAVEPLSQTTSSLEAQQTWMKLIATLKSMALQSQTGIKQFIPFRTDNAASSIMLDKIDEVMEKVFPPYSSTHKPGLTGFKKGQIKALQKDLNIHDFERPKNSETMGPEKKQNVVDENQFVSRTKIQLDSMERQNQRNIEKVKQESAQFKTSSETQVLKCEASLAGE